MLKRFIQETQSRIELFQIMHRNEHTWRAAHLSNNPNNQMLSQPFQPPDTQAPPPPPPAPLSTRVLVHQSRPLQLPPPLAIPQNRQNQRGRHHLPPNEWLVRDATTSGQ